ncbi:MAG: type I restriction endonuclease subunit R, partial [Cetobacterium sp.]
NRYGYIIDFADIKKNFQETNEAYLKELNKFNEVILDDGSLPNLFAQVIEDKNYIIEQMRKTRDILFHYTTDNLEEFSSQISVIEDKTILLELKKALSEARDYCNLVKTFGDDELKKIFKKLEILKLPQIFSEVQNRINIINQKNLFNNNDNIKVMISEAMKDITFSFKKIDEEELKIISDGLELDKKWKKAISGFTENIDKDDPEYVTLQEAFIKRFKEKGFVIDSPDEFEKKSKDLDQVIKKINDLNKKNKILMNMYNGDRKFTRIHKRISEENIERKHINKKEIVSPYNEDIMRVLTTIKNDIDSKVYDRNDILKKDIYFQQTVMTEITISMKKFEINTEREDRVFIRDRVVKEYMIQYNNTYPVA